MLPIDLKQIIWCAVQQHTERFNAISFDGLRLIVDHFIEILIAHSKLLIEPIFCPAPLLQKLQNFQTHHILAPLSNVMIR